MRVLVVGLGVQGCKRVAAAGEEVVATVDPVVAGAQYKALEDVPLESFDAALVCTPDQTKVAIVRYLLSHRKHVLVEKPLLAADAQELRALGELARATRTACYTAYNHRFEPQIVRLKELLASGTLGKVYVARLFYGNGTALDVRRSAWRDQGSGVLADLGSHLLDLTLFLFRERERTFELWSVSRFENRAADHVAFGSPGRPILELEVTLLSWRNTFTIDVLGELGSAHVDGLCKWGPSRLTLRKRVFPSGRPEEAVDTLDLSEPTWAMEYQHFKQVCQVGGTNIESDLWINGVLNRLAGDACERFPS